MKKILCAILCLGMLMGCSTNASKSKYEELSEKGITLSKATVDFTGSFDAFILNDKNDGKYISVALYDQYKDNKLSYSSIVYIDNFVDDLGVEILIEDNKIPEKVNTKTSDESKQFRSFNEWLTKYNLSREDLIEIYDYLKTM